MLELIHQAQLLALDTYRKPIMPDVVYLGINQYKKLMNNCTVYYENTPIKPQCIKIIKGMEIIRVYKKNYLECGYKK